MVGVTFEVVSLFARTPSPDLALAADRRILGALERAGADLAVAREVRHYLYVADEDAMTIAVGCLTDDYAIDVLTCASGNGRLVVAARDEVVDLTTLARSRGWFEQLASIVRGGHYDGWDAAVSGGRTERAC